MRRSCVSENLKDVSWASIKRTVADANAFYREWAGDVRTELMGTTEAEDKFPTSDEIVESLRDCVTRLRNGEL